MHVGVVVTGEGAISGGRCPSVLLGRSGATMAATFITSPVRNACDEKDEDEGSRAYQRYRFDTGWDESCS